MSTYAQGSFEIIEHTADVGISVKAHTLEGLFEVAALALTELITDAAGLSQRVEHHFQLPVEEPDILLVNWLQEILYLLDTQGLIWGRFQVKLGDAYLEARAWGELLDPKIHEMKTEIKAVTYHLLKVVKTDQGWQAQVIFDI